MIDPSEHEQVKEVHTRCVDLQTDLALLFLVSNSRSDSMEIKRNINEQTVVVRNDTLRCYM